MSTTLSNGCLANTGALVAMDSANRNMPLVIFYQAQFIRDVNADFEMNFLLPAIGRERLIGHAGATGHQQ